MTFWSGFIVGVLVFALVEWVLVRTGLKALIKDGELVIGFYDKKRDQWKVNRKFHQYAAAIDARRHSRPGSVKYID